jgi:hypothetical protein
MSISLCLASPLRLAAPAHAAKQAAMCNFERKLESPGSVAGFAFQDIFSSTSLAVRYAS